MPRNDPNEWLTPKQVRKRYGIPYAQLLSMRLARAPHGCGKFPVEKGLAGRKTLRLKVTEPLHEYLAGFKRK